MRIRTKPMIAKAVFENGGGGTQIEEEFDGFRSIPSGAQSPPNFSRTS